MNREIRGLIESAKKHKEDRKFSVKLYIFLVCLAISVFIWVLVRLSKEYYYTVDYTLVYTEFPSAMRLVQASDSVISLKLKAQGYDLFLERALTGSDNRYEISLRDLKVKSNGSVYTGFILTPSLGYEIISQTGYPHTYLTTSPDTIFFEFEYLGHRRNR
ncbi:MAG TPA: hypothetical protein PKJ28_04655 [Bacteroidales bacterium]|nr:hypothetical protein [Bacteroidales bacterium]HPS73813.1 hypothetical protein [Bacteroidales bacterium]